MSYSEAKERYAQIGVDTESVIEKLGKISISMHCWQGDDVNGFEDGGDLSGGIAATGDYPGRARNAEELMKDIDFALKQIPGTHRINLHAIYAVTDEKVDRDKLEPKHFEAWVKFAKERGLKLDFNPTLFSHPNAKDNLTLSHPDEKIRKFWVDHCKACRRIAAYFGEELGSPSLCNIWIPDGYKNLPADRLSPRMRLKKSLDEIYSVEYSSDYIVDSVESKVFGMGIESYTVGSHEFYMNYAAKNGVLCLLDNGHYHPTEMVSDKLSSMLLFADKVALHVTRPVRWDSDHTVLLEDEIKEIAKEIVRCNAIDRVLIGMDYFDASINRIAAWVTGMQAMQQALMIALLTPDCEMQKMQDKNDFTQIMVMQEKLKLMPFGEVWNEFCKRNGVNDNWYEEVVKYEQNVLAKRA